MSHVTVSVSGIRSDWAGCQLHRKIITSNQTYSSLLMSSTRQSHTNNPGIPNTYYRCLSRPGSSQGHKLHLVTVIDWKYLSRIHILKSKSPMWLGLQGDPTSPFWRRSALGFLWKEWCLSWNSSTLATSWEELTHWKRLWCWERLGAGGEGDDRGWDRWMPSLTRWTWVWVNSGSWW